MCSSHRDYYDKAAQQLTYQDHTVLTFQDVDKAMREYTMVTGGSMKTSLKPQLLDSYMPSELQRDCQLAFIVLWMTVTGFAAYKIAKSYFYLRDACRILEARRMLETTMPKLSVTYLSPRDTEGGLWI